MTRPAPTPLPTWESFTVIFIDYLSLIDHEMNFEINLFFSFTEVVWHLENFYAFAYINMGINATKWWIWNFLSVRRIPLKKMDFLLFIMCFRAFWVFLRNLLRYWDQGRPPLLGQIPSFHFFILMAPLMSTVFLRVKIVYKFICLWILNK